MKWGFANAISYFRTHGDLRKSKNENREDRELIKKLDNISGEILSLTPTIIHLKEKVGKITSKVLLQAPQTIYG